MLTKVSLHPLAKTFSLMEACSRLLFSFLVSLRIVFFYTSCQPNWSLVSDVGGQEKVHMVIPLLNKTTLGTQPTIIYKDSMYMEQSINCVALPILTIVFFTIYIQVSLVRGHLSYFTIDLIDFFTVCLVLP